MAEYLLCSSMKCLIGDDEVDNCKWDYSFNRAAYDRLHGPHGSAT